MSSQVSTRLWDNNPIVSLHIDISSIAHIKLQF
jgi:hypothetical protein